MGGNKNSFVLFGLTLAIFISNHKERKYTPKNKRERKPNEKVKQTNLRAWYNAY